MKRMMLRLTAGLMIVLAAALIFTHLQMDKPSAFRLHASEASLRQEEKMTFPWPEGDVDINAGDVQELDRLYGVGPAIAQSIIEERETNGAFLFPEDLLAVRGIGQKTLDKLWNQIFLPKPDYH